MLEANPGFGFTTLAAVSQTFAANHWYRLKVDWSTTGAIVGKLFDSNGTTLLSQVSSATTTITSGGIAFRTIGSDKYWDTVTDTHTANAFGIANAASNSKPTTSSDTLAPPFYWTRGLAAWLAELEAEALAAARAHASVWRG